MGEQTVDRVLVMPRWAAGPTDDWYPWLRERLAADPATSTVNVEVLEHETPSAPSPASSAATLRAALGDDADAARRTVVVGHSVGVQGWLHALASVPDTLRVAGMLAVAGWWFVDEPWPPLEPWLDGPGAEALARVAIAVPRFVVLLSDNDPYTSDHAANARRWRERLQADVRVLSDRKHFNAAREPDVLAALRELLVET